jgi:dynein heavy chain
LLTQTQISGGGGVGETDEMIAKLATDILGKVPKPFDVEAVSEQYPVLYTNSMNTVLRQVSYQNGIFYCHFYVAS